MPSTTISRKFCTPPGRSRLNFRAASGNTIAMISVKRRVMIVVSVSQAWAPSGKRNSLSQGVETFSTGGGPSRAMSRRLTGP